MDSQPLVSVVVPCLNRAAYLEPTLKSILLQTYPNIECIVVDGGSKDGTVDILKSYGKRISWTSEPDQGHADAINKGWHRSRGEILAWLNADDVWEQGAAAAVVRYFLDNPQVDVVYGDCGAIDESGRPAGMSYCHEWDLKYAIENCDHCIPQPVSFIRRSILEKVGWLDTSIQNVLDRDLFLRIGLIGNICHIPVKLASARNIKGITYRGDITATGIVQTTKKFLLLADACPNLHIDKKKARSRSYFIGAAYAFKGDHKRLAVKYWLGSIKVDPIKGTYWIARYFLGMSWDFINNRRM